MSETERHPLPPLTRLIMVAEWLDSAAAYQDRPGAMEEHEANAAVLRSVYRELLRLGVGVTRAQYAQFVADLSERLDVEAGLADVRRRVQHPKEK